jgi:ATP-dependent Lon protease
MKVTGQVGKVMNESSEISLTYARSFVRELAPNNSYLEEAHIHLNVPEGAIPKDGPSAGVTMTTALLSLALGVPVRTDLAMTGELTITGQVLRVGGIKEKIIAARREEVTTIILPRQCEADFHELKEYIREGITAHFVDHYDDVYRLAFDDVAVPPLLRPSLGRPVSTVPAPTLEGTCPNSESGVFIPIAPEPVPVSTSLAPKLASK